MTKHLPARPRVVGGLPVLRRKQGELQIGLDPRHATVVEGLPDTVVAAAQRLTGHRTTTDLLDGLAPADRDGFTELLKALLDQGFLEDAAGAPARRPGEALASAVHALHTEVHPIERADLKIAVRGDGRLAVTVACLLAGAGVGWVHVSASGAVQPEDVGTGYLPDDVGVPRRVAARRAVRRAAANVRTAPFGSAHSPDLVVLTDALVPRPEEVDMLTAGTMPHLLVRARDTTGIVGPFVVPGLTSCLRCADLHRCDRDECWPQLAVQLAGQAQLTDVAGTHATAAFAVMQALDAAAWLRGGSQPPPATCEVSVELDLRSVTARHRGWSPHPGCQCGVARRRFGDQSHYTKGAADKAEELRQSHRDGDAS
jgi:bacteriocin biosynthesis cyclodehydratase domain-containing protein